MNNRGSHVGVILSFVIFVTFLLFLYSIVEPKLGIQKDREALLDYLRLELMSKFSSNLTSITVSVDSVYSRDCVILNDFLEEASVDSRLIAKNEEGEIAEIYISSSDAKDLIIYRNNQEGFFKIYNSNEFAEKETRSPGFMECTPLEKDAEWHGIPSGYSIPLTKEEEYIFESRIISLIGDYSVEKSYNDMREEFKIPEGSDFGFNFIYTNESVIETEEKQTPANVYVREIPVQYVDQSANISLGKVNIKVW